MRNNSNTPSQTATAATAPKPAASQKLERTRSNVCSASRDIQTVEGKLLDLTTADCILRALHNAERELSALSISIAVLERRCANG